MHQLNSSRALVIIAVVLILGCGGGSGPDRTAEHRSTDALGSRLESVVPELMRQARVPGLQIALVRDREVVWEQGFGVAENGAGEPVTTDTVFEAASLTKPVFAYAVMRLVDRGLVDLDEPILDRLPEDTFEGLLGHPVDAEGYRHDLMATITPRHVLSHSAGTAHGDRTNPYTLFFDPGTDWKYSAEGYQLLQLMVEHLDGRSLDEIVDSLVLDPLGMTRSGMVWRDEFDPVMAHGHDLFGMPSDLRRRHQPTAAASLYTTAGDYALFVIAVMEGRGLEPETAAEMLGWTVDMSDDGGVGWSLGFGLQRHEDDVAFWQWGDYGIFRNYVIASRERGDGVVYLTNSFNGLAVCDELVRAAFDEPAMGCLELDYQAFDSPFYEFFWAVEAEGPGAVAPRLPALIESNPDFFTPERISGMGEILEGAGMAEAAAECNRYNLRANPESGAMMLRAARAEVLVGDHDAAGRLLVDARNAAEDPADGEQIAWLEDYITALDDPVRIDDAQMLAIAGDYGPRHIVVVDGELAYLRDGTGVSAPRPLRAIAPDTFMIIGVPDFKLRVAFDGTGRPMKLVGLYPGGGADESPRD